ncbi:lysine-specific demethylase JMJ18 [Tanacetum coccineum]
MNTRSTERAFYDFMEGCLCHKSEMVIFEAVREITKLNDVSSREPTPVIMVLQLFLSSSLAVLRFAAVRTLNKVLYNMISPASITPNTSLVPILDQWLLLQESTNITGLTHKCAPRIRVKDNGGHAYTIKEEVVHPKKEPHLGKGYHNVLFELVNIRSVAVGKLWCNKKAIFLKGYLSRVKFRSFLNPTLVRSYIMEIHYSGLIGPIYKVFLEEYPSESVMDVSTDKCWELVLQRLKGFIKNKLKSSEEHGLLDVFQQSFKLWKFNTIAGNPVKEILLKLNLPDHKSILTDSKDT